MRSLLSRVASVICMLVFVQGAVAQCAGWQATPEARRQCCQNGSCPLHRHKDEAGRAQFTQAAADDCCATSQEHQSGKSASIFAPTITFAVLESLPPAVVNLAPTTPVSAPWEAWSPPTHVAKHLLLSVLLV